MTVVYIDSLFLLNLIVNYLLLLATGKVAGALLRRRFLALGAAVGGLYAVAIFLPNMGFLTHPVFKLATAVVMVLVGFGHCRRLLRVALVFFGLSCALAGGMFAIELLGGQGLSLRHGVFYTGMDLRILLLSAAACYVVLTLIFRRTANHNASELTTAVLHFDDRRISFTALVDTGNTLTDPVTGQPVMVAEVGVVVPLLPQLKDVDITDPIGALETLSKTAHHRDFRLLPYRAVGVDRGLLLAVRTHRAQVGHRSYQGLLVALSPNSVSDGGGYQGLIGVEP